MQARLDESAVGSVGNASEVLSRQDLPLYHDEVIQNNHIPMALDSSIPKPDC